MQYPKPTQDQHLSSLKTLLEDLGVKVMTYDEALEKVPAKQKCGCDTVINGKTGHICQDHLFEQFAKDLNSGKIKPIFLDKE